MPPIAAEGYKKTDPLMTFLRTCAAGLSIRVFSRQGFKPVALNTDKLYDSNIRSMKFNLFRTGIQSR